MDIKPEIKEHLMETHFEFRRLMEEHHAADERLSYLQGKVRLSSQEAVEEAELKKVKLRAKDRIFHIVEEFNKYRGQ